MADLDFTPISSLTLSSRSYMLRARVANKGKLITYPKGCMFKCLLFDRSGSIELVFYNDLCNKFFEQVENEQVYIVSKADIS